MCFPPFGENRSNRMIQKNEVRGEMRRVVPQSPCNVPEGAGFPAVTSDVCPDCTAVKMTFSQAVTYMPAGVASTTISFLTCCTFNVCLHFLQREERAKGIWRNLGTPVCYELSREVWRVRDPLKKGGQRSMGRRKRAFGMWRGSGTVHMSVHEIPEENNRIISD